MLHLTPSFTKELKSYTLNSEDTPTDSEAVTFSNEEVAEVIHSLKANKAEGADGTDAEH